MDEADYAQQNEELFRRVAFANHARQRGNMGDGNYGDTIRNSSELRSCPHNSCQDCGGEIGEKRLRANPAATRCIKCQAKAENKIRR